MNIISMFIPMTTMFLLTGVMSGIWPSASPIYAQIKNQTSTPTIDQLASNLTRANSELLVEVWVPKSRIAIT